MTTKHNPTPGVQQRIRPADVETPPRSTPTVPLVPPELSTSEKGDPDRYPSPALPVAHSPRPRKNLRRCCCRCLCFTISTTILLVVAVAATLGVLYLVFGPKLPSYSVDRFHVSGFAVDLNQSAHATFDVTVTATNPNKRIGIYYLSGSRLSFLWQGYDLCQGALPEFYQGHRNTTVLTVTLMGEAQLGWNKTKELQQEQLQETVPLEFKGVVPVRVELGRLKLWKVTSGMRCSLVVDNLRVNSRINIKASSCKVDLTL